MTETLKTRDIQKMNMSTEARPIVMPSVPAEEDAYDAVRAAKELARSNEMARRTQNARLKKFMDDTQKRAEVTVTSQKLEGDAPGSFPSTRKQTRTEFELAFDRAELEFGKVTSLLSKCS